MGKVKPRIPSGKFVLLNRVNANGESSIQLRFHMDGYVKILPAIKIDVFAVDVKYQKLHLNEESRASDEPSEHFYFADKIMCDVVLKCRSINDNEITARYILLYADKKALRFYQRNSFGDFSDYMEREHNMETDANIPMYMEL